MRVTRKTTEMNCTERSTGRRSRALGALVLAILGSLCLTASAGAASTHTFLREWSAGAGCDPHDIATDAAGNVYVACAGENSTEHWGSIKKFAPDGTPIPFASSKPYINGNEIAEDPGSSGGSFGDEAYIAVDKSSARPGWI
jgi:hypothetical protein